MEVLPNTNRQDTTSVTAPSAASDDAAISADFETFLQLLTAQLKNQDPLNPMENTEFATQLATFSGVEQQVRTNELLENLNNGFSTSSLSELGNWIGMDAMAEMPAVFDGAPIRVQATPPDGADWMELIVTDVAGNVVQRQPLPLSDATFSWTGETPQGDAVPPGIYQLSVQSWSGETLLGTQNANVRATIEEAQLLNGEVVLTMAGGVRVPADEILRISRGTGE